jgi:hypothetical protein
VPDDYDDGDERRTELFLPRTQTMDIDDDDDDDSFEEAEEAEDVEEIFVSDWASST